MKNKNLVPHAGIEPATFCLLDRRSATEPMRRMVELSMRALFNRLQMTQAREEKASELAAAKAKADAQPWWREWKAE